MPEELEGDLADTVVWGADMRRSLFRHVDLAGTRVTHSSLIDVEIDGIVDRLVVNGVDVTTYVNERDRWYPLRTALQADAPGTLRSGWAALDEAWTALEDRARTLPEEHLHRQVDGEWSFVETVRHLVMATDKWFTAPIEGGPFHPIGLPNTGSLDFGWPGIDPDAAPSAAEAIDVWSGRRVAVGAALATVADADLDRVVEVLENGSETVRECFRTVVEEAFWHLRYADRDLTTLSA